MLQDMWLECQENLDRLLDEEKLQNGYVVVFGSNEPAERMADYLEIKHIKIQYFVDNNYKQWGRMYKDIKTEKPENVLGKFIPNAVILIASRYFNEMSLQLRKMGYKLGVHIFKVVEYNASSEFSVDENVFEDKLLRVNRGVAKIDEIQKQFGKDKHILICPHKGLGDAYIFAKLVRPYMKENHIENTVLVVIGAGCLKVLKLFQLPNGISVTSTESIEMIQAATFLGFKECRVMVLHHILPYTNQVRLLGCYKELNFLELFQVAVCGLKRGIELDEPIITKEQRDDAERIFEEYGLEKGKTVILAPFSNTIPLLDPNLWNEKVKSYKEQGYMVVTNCGGPEEHAIEGTIEVRVDISCMIPFCELAGTFISLRSGLCDVISSANCKKILYYPNRVYRYGKSMDFYSLKNMGLSENVEEIEL